MQNRDGDYTSRQETSIHDVDALGNAGSGYAGRPDVEPARGELLAGVRNLSLAHLRVGLLIIDRVQGGWLAIQNLFDGHRAWSHSRLHDFTTLNIARTQWGFWMRSRAGECFRSFRNIRDLCSLQTSRV
jgi:hypothetical protein